MFVCCEVLCVVR